MEPNLHRKTWLKKSVYRFQVFFNATENILEEDGLETESINNIYHNNIHFSLLEPFNCRVKSIKEKYPKCIAQ